MAEPQPPTKARSYGCTFGCGNPYDYVVVAVADGTTEFLCLPCYVKLAAEMVEAVTNADSQDVKKALSYSANLESAPMTSNGVRPRGKNAPVTSDDDDLVEAYSGVITEDELPEEFR